MLTTVEQLFDTAARDPAPCVLNTDAIRWIEERNGKAYVALLGIDKIFEGHVYQRGIVLTGSVLDAVRKLCPDALELTRDDRAERPQFQGPVYVARQNIRLITPIKDFFSIEFTDGSTLGVKDISNVR